MKYKSTLFLLALFFSNVSFSTEKNTIRIGVLAFGTANWELAVLKNQGLLDTADFKLDIHPVANSQAAKIALQSGAVDMIISDWIWVSRMRSTGADFSFYPYSTTSGALVVPNSSNIRELKDLQGKKLGIAGGELDKNWLLLQALAQQQNQLDLNNSVEKVYGAPPLLNQQLLKNHIAAVINYWHYAARLEAKGYRQIIDGHDLLNKLGIKHQVPVIGYVFKESWASQNKTRVKQFLQLTKKAKDQLCDSDQVWQKIIPLTKAIDKATQLLLRQKYCEGRIKTWGNNEQQAATKIYKILHKLSANKLTGNSAYIQTGTFWNID